MVYPSHFLTLIKFCIAFCLASNQLLLSITNGSKHIKVQFFKNKYQNRLYLKILSSLPSSFYHNHFLTLHEAHGFGKCERAHPEVTSGSVGNYRYLF